MAMIFSSVALATWQIGQCLLSVRFVMYIKFSILILNPCQLTYHVSVLSGLVPEHIATGSGPGIES